MIKKDIFNSKIFEMQMGNISLDSDESLFDVLKVAQREGYEHVSIKVPTGNKELVNQCFKEGFMLADTLVSFVFDFNKSVLANVQHKCIIREYKDSDLEGIMQIAKNSFKIDRFHSDPNLDNELCDKYYEQWIYNSCHGFADNVLVAEYNNEVVGFTTGKVYEEDNEVHLVLSAVSSKYRGLGIYTSMIYEGVKWAKQFKTNRLIVGTQIDNVAVQKAWIKLGFTLKNSEYVLQKKI